MLRVSQGVEDWGSPSEDAMGGWKKEGGGKPPGTEVSRPESRALRARNPKRVRKESERVSRPGGPQSPQRVRHGVRKESKNAASDSFWTLFGLRGALFGDSAVGLPGAGHPFGLFSRTPWGGGKKRGVENLTNDTPPKKGFWTPPRTVRFPP